jgi:two-component sensor histidine kinase
MAIERQRIERDLRMALDQREILLQVVNHRVKNSLQLVASMLHLQASAAEGEETRQQLHEASSRISAIARAHQRLYRSNQVSTVDLAAYLVDVCDDLNLTNTDCTVEVQVPEPIEIATDRAIPLALVVNELVTNAIKYAYPDTQRCRVLVSLRRADDDGIVLSIEDEGVGLPAGFAVTSSKGLGMRIVAAFAQQLGADLQVRPRDPGTAFVLLLPLGTNGKGG